MVSNIRLMRRFAAGHLKAFPVIHDVPLVCGIGASGGLLSIAHVDDLDIVVVIVIIGVVFGVHLATQWGVVTCFKTQYA